MNIAKPELLYIQFAYDYCNFSSNLTFVLMLTTGYYTNLDKLNNQNKF